MKRKEVREKEEKFALTVENTSDLSKEGTDPFGTFGDLDVQELLHRK